MRPTPLSLALLAAATVAAAPAAAQSTLTILHTNDVHSRLEPISKYDGTCGAEDNAAGECFGGSARLITAVREARAAAPDSLLLDGGDQFQGTLFYTYYKGMAAAEMMNAMGYDAMTVGNHEFDDGPEVLRGFMDAVDFPVLMSNADVSAEPALAGVLRPSTVVEVGGARVGLVGLTPADTPDLSSPGPHVVFEPPEAALRREIARLTEDGVDRIVVLSHSGYGVDRRVAAAVPGIDVIVGGHTNTFLSNVSDRAEGPYPTMVEGPEGDPVAIVQAYAFGKFLGKLEVAFDADGVVTSAVGEPLLLDAAVAEDSAVKGRLEELAEPLVAIREAVVGEAAAPIDGDRANCRATVCEMGVLVAEAMLEAARPQGAEVAITNGGGLRASIDAGPVTMGEVLTVLPFQNTLATFGLPGAALRTALENGVSQVEDGAGRFPQVAGMRFVWDPAAAPGARIVSVEIADGAGGFAPLEDERVYSVVSNNFMRGGGDGYEAFETQAIDPYDYGPGLEQVVADRIAADSPVAPEVDDRIARR